MQIPSYAEWHNVICGLPNNKASSPSQICNEMLKHLEFKTQIMLWKLVCKCLEINDIPSDWKVAMIYPIPKPSEWKCKLDKTRPITLIETDRKDMVKILNSCLAKIIAK